MPSDDLKRAARAIALAARKLERATGDLSLAQYRVLALVSGGDERSSLIAERLAVAKPTITAVVDGLVERAYVARQAIEGDRRSLRLVLTPLGRKALAAAETAMADALATVLEEARDSDAILSALADLGDAQAAVFAARFTQ